MKLIIYYVGIALASDVVAVLLCLAIERFWPAVRAQWTEPRSTPT